MENRIRQLLSILCFIAFIPFANPQTATLSLPQLTTCPGNQVTVSMLAENLLNVGAITLNIGYDTAVLEFQGSGNNNPQFPGIMTNAITIPYTQVGIAWSSLTPGSVSSGILLDLYFSFKTDSCNLTFNPDCDISDIDFNPIPFDSVSGKVKQALPYIAQNPQSNTVIEGTDAFFEVTTTGADDYHWQEWNGLSWSNLQNNSLYQNVYTSQLTITATPSSLNGNWYRCFLSANGGCQIYSDSAKLTVSPAPIAIISLPDTLTCPNKEILIPIMAMGIDSCMGFRIDISFDPDVVAFKEIVNVNPLLEGITATVLVLPEPHVSLNWSSSQWINLPDGVFANLVFDFSANQTALVVLASSYILKSDMSFYNLIPQNGSITQNLVPEIIFPPSDTTVALGTTTQFYVEATDAIAFHWFESQDNGSNWQLLTDNGVYSGSQSQNLSIGSVSFAFNAYRYRCKVFGTFCDTTTTAATLLVDTLITSADEGIRINQVETLSILSQKLKKNELTVDFEANEAGILTIIIFDIQGRLVWNLQNKVKQIGKQTLTKRFLDLEPGTYLLQYLFVSPSGLTQICHKTVLNW
jgi:hypothetical protein